MIEIKMVDLHGQYLKIKQEIDDAISKVIESAVFIRGKEVSFFQDELAAYLECGNVIACGNGTDALQLALMALDLKPGDEVITTPFTFIATVEVVRLLGLTPVMVDVEEDTFNINTDLLDRQITERTRAIVPVHLFGQCVNMDKILEIARDQDLFVIEDNAQAIGADYTDSAGISSKAGTLGIMGTTSFFPSKNLGCFGDGGAIFTQDDDMGEKLKALAHHGMRQRYHYDYVGVNSRLDTIQAAILRVKLKYLDSYHIARQNAAGFYDTALAGIDRLILPERSPFSTHIFHQYTLKIPADIRDDLKLWLQEKNIPSMVYYPLPLHLQRAYTDLGYKPGDLPVSEGLSKKVLSLPMHTELDEEQLNYITSSIISYFNT